MSEKQQKCSGAKAAKKHLILTETGAAPEKSLPEESMTIPSKDGKSPSADNTNAPVTDEAKFQKFALPLVENQNMFGVLAIRIDTIDNILNKKKSIKNFKEIIEKTINKAGGASLMTNNDIFGCLLPDANEKKCRSAAKKISSQIALLGTETASIGIAAYPTLSYDKKNIYQNAKKALAHGDFFGPGSTVCFDAVSLNISGDMYYQAGDLSAAMAEYESALLLDPKNVNVHNSIGVCHGDKGDSDKALASFTKAMELDPGDVFAIYNAGYIHMQKEAFEDALKYFKRALEIEDNIFELLVQAGRALYELNQPEEALSYLNLAISKNENPGGTVYRFIGDCHLALEQKDEAIKAYNTALKLRSDDAHALSAVAFCYESDNRNPEIALVFSENAVAIQPENGLFNHRLAVMYANRNRHEDALDLFETAVKCGHEESRKHFEVTKGLVENITKQKVISSI